MILSKLRKGQTYFLIIKRKRTNKSGRKKKMSKKNPKVDVPETTEVSAQAADAAKASPKAFSLPYKVTCSKCGAVKAVRHEVLLKRLVGVPGNTLEERFQNHIAGYKCQVCKREEKNAAIQADLAVKAQQSAAVAPAAQ